jgi:uncharacterized protein YjdB
MTPLTASAATLDSTLTLNATTNEDHPDDGYSWETDGANGGTLTLNSFGLDTLQNFGILFDTSVSGAVEIVLNGTSSVTGALEGILAYHALPLIISGSGSLAVNGGRTGIYATGNVEITGNAVVRADGGDSYGIYVYGNFEITGNTDVTARGGDYGIYTISGGIEISGDAIVKATGANGHEAIKSYDSDVVIDKGVVFENGVGTVYGDVTLPGDLTVESDETLTVTGGAILTIPSGTTLTNNGTVTNNETMTIDDGGILTNNGTVTNNGAINNNGAISGNAITGSGTIVVPPTKVSKVTITNSASVYTYKAADAVHTMLHAVSILPANATVKKVTWKSSNNAIATVNATGLVTFTGKEGTVRITATSPDGPAHYKDIKVVKNVTKLRTPLTARNLTVKKKISVKPMIDDGSTVITAELTYKSSNPKIATVDAKGNVKGIKKGKATITIQANNGKKATVKINVAKKAVKLKKFTLTGIRKNALTLQKGKTKDLKIKLAQSKASDLKVTFKSSKSSVAKVDAAGRITAVKKGTAAITAKVGSKTVKVKVTVK